MKIGFIGTSHGLTSTQLEKIIELMFPLSKQEVEIHYSNSSETDAQFHRAVCNFLLHKKIIIHQITNKSCFSTLDVIGLSPTTFADVRKNIVDECEILWLAPKNDYEAEKFNSVKYALEYAKKKNKDIKIITVDGEIHDWPDMNHIPKSMRKKLKTHL